MWRIGRRRSTQHWVALARPWTRSDTYLSAYSTRAHIRDFVAQKFTNPLPESPPLFVSAEAHAALQRSIALHFLRTGQFETAETFNTVSQVAQVDVTTYLSMFYRSQASMWMNRQQSSSLGCIPCLRPSGIAILGPRLRMLSRTPVQLRLLTY